MDPLSISVSIIGLCCAAVQVNGLLKAFVDSAKDAPASARHTLSAVSGIYVCLNQLDAFLSGRQESQRSRRSLVMVEQVVIIFTDCVAIFSELEQTLESLKMNGPMRAIDRVKWAMKEKAIMKLLTRLQTCKASLSLVLNILTCASMESAENTTKDLTASIQRLLKSNINMSRRLKNIERMHPALNLSACPSLTTSIYENHPSQRSDLTQTCETSFEKELQSTPVYKRTAFNRIRASNSSSNAHSVPSFLSGLSLSDVSNVTAMALPISRTELWNHHRYIEPRSSKPQNGASTLEACKKSAFIRTVYFDGQYTNQYAQTKCTGHLIYRRFDITGPDRPPQFKEGLVLASNNDSSPLYNHEDQNMEQRAELEDTSSCAIERDLMGSNIKYNTMRREQDQYDVVLAVCWDHDSSSAWGQGVIGLLSSIHS
ncbi:MAG: hypothetical protein Q9182_000489 [Xanthomendoza sp. 2 TL-2023]